MLISQENYEIRNRVIGFEKRIEEMHMDFYNYYNGLEQKMPDWEGFERELILYSRKRISDLELSKNLDRILYKFQNRKKIWLKWAAELHHISKK
ncbi:hypothetical protein ACFLZG_07295 [Thermodesulfobacteriota bacterium]